MHRGLSYRCLRVIKRHLGRTTFHDDLGRQRQRHSSDAYGRIALAAGPIFHDDHGPTTLNAHRALRRDAPLWRRKKEMAEATCDIGLIGLAVMGQNLVLNMNDHGYKVAVFNRTVSKVDDFINNEAKGTKVVGAHTMEEFCGLLKSPRRVMIMVKAGEVVDQTIEHVLPFLEKGDIIIDGGNSLFTDSNRRTKDLAAKGIQFIGTGVSGGEEGARFGPSIMPGGNKEAWPHVKEIFQAIAAKVEDGT